MILSVLAGLIFIAVAFYLIKEKMYRLLMTYIALIAISTLALYFAIEQIEFDLVNDVSEQLMGLAKALPPSIWLVFIPPMIFLPLIHLLKMKKQ